MNKVTKEQYEFALARVEELLPLVDDNIPANDKNAVELSVMSDIVIAYEKEHYPIEKPTVVELILFFRYFIHILYPKWLNNQFYHILYG